MTQTPASHAPTPAEVPVLISGSGPVGLVLSILLSRQGIRNVVVEKRDRINTLPRARGITVRTVEILEQLGLREELESIGLPAAWIRNFIYTERLATQLVGVMPATAMALGAAQDRSPANYVVAAQDRIDPMLYNAAKSHPEAEVCFSTEVVGYVEDADGVTTTVRKPNGTLTHIRSSYLVAADGGKSRLRELAGIGSTGRSNLRSFINNHIRADLSRFTAGREGALIWTLAPGFEGVFQMLDGDKLWAVQVQYDPEASSAEVWTEETALKRLRGMIGDPAAQALEIEILKAYPYTLSSMVADRLRKGRLLLTGDAAHQIPPYGGFGLNTGIQSAHNLAWKLATVLRGEAAAGLLDTYDTERREVARRVCDFGRTNSGYVEQLMNAVRNARCPEERASIVASSRQYGTWWGLDLGVHYECDGAFVRDAVPAPQVADPVIEYIPHAKPGYRAPHFWALHRGQRITSLSLFEREFVLLVGPKGYPWIDAARNAGARLRPSIAAYRVAPDGDLAAEVDFCSLYGVSSSGAVLVRPDGHVAYRSIEAPRDPLTQLRGVLDQVLRRH
jgi:putative polyketide hydroxylase